jgi:hypothetical protein
METSQIFCHYVCRRLCYWRLRLAQVCLPILVSVYLRVFPMGFIVTGFYGFYFLSFEHAFTIKVTVF